MKKTKRPVLLLVSALICATATSVLARNDNKLEFYESSLRPVEYAQATPPAPTVGAQSITLAPSSDATAAIQAEGQAVLDTLPGFNIFTNFPSATFDQASFEMFVGLQNTGSVINNDIGAHYNLVTNFYVGGEVTLGATQNIIGSAQIGGGWRKAWVLWEIYGGALVGRDFINSVFEGEPVIGVNWKPSSGFAVNLQIGIPITKETFSKGAKGGAPTTVNFDIVIPIGH